VKWDKIGFALKAHFISRLNFEVPVYQKICYSLSREPPAMLSDQIKKSAKNKL
jgi:hypothetical protein